MNNSFDRNVILLLAKILKTTTARTKKTTPQQKKRLSKRLNFNIHNKLQSSLLITDKNKETFF